MRIKATVTKEITVTVKDFAAFKAQYPEAIARRIDGVAADAVCANGHPHQSEYGCYECREEEPCPDCGVKNKDCECMPF